jgi:hypothetical protein
MITSTRIAIHSRISIAPATLPIPYDWIPCKKIKIKQKCRKK